MVVVSDNVGRTHGVLVAGEGVMGTDDPVNGAIVEMALHLLGEWHVYPGEWTDEVVIANFMARYGHVPNQIIRQMFIVTAGPVGEDKCLGEK